VLKENFTSIVRGETKRNRMRSGDLSYVDTAVTENAGFPPNKGLMEQEKTERRKGRHLIESDREGALFPASMAPWSKPRLPLRDKRLILGTYRY